MCIHCARPRPRSRHDTTRPDRSIDEWIARCSLLILDARERLTFTFANKYNIKYHPSPTHISSALFSGDLTLASQALWPLRTAAHARTRARIAQIKTTRLNLLLLLFKGASSIILYSIIVSDICLIVCFWRRRTTAAATAATDVVKVTD